MKRKLSVLFLCSHNSARSQMAEALLRYYGGERFEAYSAGLEPSQLNPYTVLVLHELGLNSEGQYAKDLMTFWGGKYHFTYLITVCDKAEAKCPIFPFATRRLYWPFEDPSSFEGSDEEKLAKFRQVRDQIAAKIREWVREESTQEGQFNFKD